MSESPAISTEGLTKHYGDVRAVQDLDLEISEGEVFGFLGPNGSGKTTTMRTILDLIRPTAGKASILGMDSHEMAIEIRRHVGYVPGELALYPKLTGRQLLDYFAHLRGGVEWSFVDELAGRFEADLGKRVNEYSTGNRQKIGLIQAFMNRPQVLILDEPSIGLDPLVQQELHGILRDAAGEGRTVFLSSHTLSEVERVADRVGIIRKGRLVVVETIDALKAKAIRSVTMDFAEDIDPSIFEGVDGIRDAEISGSRATLTFEGSMSEVLRVATQHEIVNMSSTEADLEEIFLTYYRNAEKAELGAGAH